jgi:hypothetical protein
VNWSVLFKDLKKFFYLVSVVLPIIVGFVKEIKKTLEA